MCAAAARTHARTRNRCLDVWAILTDYDQLAVHVPNLVQSRVLELPASGVWPLQAGNRFAGKDPSQVGLEAGARSTKRERAPRNKHARS